MPASRLQAAALSLLWLTACGEEPAPEVPLDGGVECVVAEDCGSQGAELGCVAGECVPVTEPEQWSCLKQEPLEPTTTTHTIRVEIVTGASGDPAAGATVRLCDDIDCSNLLAGPFVTDETGFVYLDVPSGFNGFILSELDGTVPMATLRGPIYADYVFEIPHLSRSFLILTAGSFGIPWSDDPTKPVAVVTDFAGGCPGFGAAGAQVSLLDSSPNQLRAYRQSGILDPTATETDDAGVVFFLNVDAGEGSVVARSAASQRLIASQVAPTRPGWGTYVLLDPVANR